MRHVVEEHGGSVAFTSEPGVGTQFTVRLPGPAQNGGERGASA
ncbi:MAG TPA: hypothetical protein VFA35_06775 [Burkholderiaceae bacterium]|nr:hypothetical protein [Burkholderiaceae bacterium]